MLYLGRSLGYLLTRHSKISLHQLGTFRSSWSADLGWSVDFTPENLEHSSALLTYISKQNTISEKEAIQALDLFVSNLKQQLKNSNKFEIEHFGKLLLRNQTLHFLLDGKEDVFIREGYTETAFETPNSDPNQEILQNSEPVLGEEVVDLDSSPMIQDTYPSEGAPTKNYAWILTLSVVALVIISFLGIRYVNPQWTELIETRVLSLLNVKNSNSVDAIQEEHVPDPDPGLSMVSASADSLGIQDDSLGVDFDQQDSLRVENRNEELIEGAVPAEQMYPDGYRYEIVVASFTTIRQAEKYIDDMKKKGYNFNIMDSQMAGNRKKVIWGTYSSENEANLILKKVQKEFEAGAWVAKVPQP